MGLTMMFPVVGLISAILVVLAARRFFHPGNGLHKKLASCIPGPWLVHPLKGGGLVTQAMIPLWQRSGTCCCWG
ncbi:hypothetical protein [Effusibacillus lacus]|uniref:hypothetical protein n=1 Tax=Effusibacillus lacus TaxID=1348429 RepID=UPI000BB7CC51|nr:hypothetical protein [Effusibacillus lacus]TCS69511.1 hypothetical protein EDD64_13628 [Effusibacillus lacus]